MRAALATCTCRQPHVRALPPVFQLLVLPLAAVPQVSAKGSGPHGRHSAPHRPSNAGALGTAVPQCQWQVMGPEECRSATPTPYHILPARLSATLLTLFLTFDALLALFHLPAMRALVLGLLLCAHAQLSAAPTPTAALPGRAGGALTFADWRAGSAAALAQPDLAMACSLGSGRVSVAAAAGALGGVTPCGAWSFTAWVAPAAPPRSGPSAGAGSAPARMLLAQTVSGVDGDAAAASIYLLRSEDAAQGSGWAVALALGQEGSSEFRPPGLVPAGVWTYLALSWDPALGLAALSLNGSATAPLDAPSYAAGDALASAACAPALRVHLGGTPSHFAPFVGSLDEVALWGAPLYRALEGGWDAAALAQAALGLPHPSMLARWGMNEAAGNSSGLYDAIGGPLSSVLAVPVTSFSNASDAPAYLVAASAGAACAPRWVPSSAPMAPLQGPFLPTSQSSGEGGAWEAFLDLPIIGSAAGAQDGDAWAVLVTAPPAAGLLGLWNGSSWVQASAYPALACLLPAQQSPAWGGVAASCWVAVSPFAAFADFTDSVGYTVVTASAAGAGRVDAAAVLAGGAAAEPAFSFFSVVGSGSSVAVLVGGGSGSSAASAASASPTLPGMGIPGFTIADMDGAVTPGYKPSLSLSLTLSSRPAAAPVTVPTWGTGSPAALYMPHPSSVSFVSPTGSVLDATASSAQAGGGVEQLSAALGALAVQLPVPFAGQVLLAVADGAAANGSAHAAPTSASSLTLGLRAHSAPVLLAAWPLAAPSPSDYAEGGVNISLLVGKWPAWSLGAAQSAEEGALLCVWKDSDGKVLGVSPVHRLTAQRGTCAPLRSGDRLPGSIMGNAVLSLAAHSSMGAGPAAAQGGLGFVFFTPLTLAARYNASAPSLVSALTGAPAAGRRAAPGPVLGVQVHPNGIVDPDYRGVIYFPCDPPRIYPPAGALQCRYGDGSRGVGTVVPAHLEPHPSAALEPTYVKCPSDRKQYMSLVCDSAPPWALAGPADLAVNLGNGVWLPAQRHAYVPPLWTLPTAAPSPATVRAAGTAAPPLNATRILVAILDSGAAAAAAAADVALVCAVGGGGGGQVPGRCACSCACAHSGCLRRAHGHAGGHRCRGCGRRQRGGITGAVCGVCGAECAAGRLSGQWQRRWGGRCASALLPPPHT